MIYRLMLHKGRKGEPKGAGKNTSPDCSTPPTSNSVARSNSSGTGYPPDPTPAGATGQNNEKLRTRQTTGRSPHSSTLSPRRAAHERIPATHLQRVPMSFGHRPGNREAGRTAPPRTIAAGVAAGVLPP